MMMGVAQVIGMNPTLRSFFSGAAASANTAGGVPGKDGAHDRGGNDALVACLLVCTSSGARHVRPRIEVMLGLVGVPPTGARRPYQSPRIEGVIEGRHGKSLHSRAGDPRPSLVREFAMDVPSRRFREARRTSSRFICELKDVACSLGKR